MSGELGVAAGRDAVHVAEIDAPSTHCAHQKGSGGGVGSFAALTRSRGSASLMTKVNDIGVTA
jgi:hypothetical protein